MDEKNGEIFKLMPVGIGPSQGLGGRRTDEGHGSDGSGRGKGELAGNATCCARILKRDNGLKPPGKSNHMKVAKMEVS